MKPPLFLQRMVERGDARREADMVQAVAHAGEANLEQPARWGRRALWLGVAAALAWAALAPLGQGVPAHGFVGVEGSRKTIQHPRGGVVEAILVREGDHVEAEQPLIRLNEAQAQAQQGSIESQLVNLMSVEARLQAERSGQTRVAFPEFLLKRVTNPDAAQAMAVQQQLFGTRRAAADGEVGILRESLNGLERQAEGLQARELSNNQQYKLYTDEYAAIKPMYDQGFVPRQRMFELERALAYVEGQRGEDRANMGRLRSAISETRLKMAQVREAYRKEVETQLTEVQRQVGDLKERRVATLDELERVVLRAPEAGTIVELSIHTVGGVAAPGQKLMDLVPKGSKLMIEVMIPPHLIDSVQLGQAADLHFPAFDQTLVPTVEGRLVYVGADRQTDPRTDVSYFVGRVDITAEGFKQLGKQVLRPGMPAEVVIKTGERTLFAYLLKPLLTRMQTGMTER